MQQIKSWIDTHLESRTGERHRRLKEGYKFAEDSFVKEIWLPTFGNLEDLHPEYEVVDVIDGRRFLDFAYMKSGVKIGIEVDGFGPHLMHVSREQFSNQFVRDMHLRNLGWAVIHISADDVTQRPKLWRKLLQQFIGKTFGSSTTKIRDSLDIELLTFLFNLHRPFKRSDIQSHLNCGDRLSRKIMHSLLKDGWIASARTDVKRIHDWVLTDKFRFLGMPFATANEAKHLLDNFDKRRFGRNYR